MNAFYGSEVHTPNFVLRFAIIAFMGVISMGSVLFWKSQLLLTAEYQEMPITHEQLKVKKQNDTIKKRMAGKLINIEE